LGDFFAALKNGSERWKGGVLSKAKALRSLAQKKRARLGGLSLKITNFGLDITDLLMEVRRLSGASHNQQFSYCRDSKMMEDKSSRHWKIETFVGLVVSSQKSRTSH